MLFLLFDCRTVIRSFMVFKFYYFFEELKEWKEHS